MATTPSARSRELAAVFAGGVVGTLARAGLVEAAPPVAGQWPWATFAVNLLGALLLGWFLTAASGRSDVRRPFAGAGLCGALTTFSTMQLELLRMIDRGDYGLAAGYAAASVACGLAGVALGSFLKRRAI